MSKLIAGVSRLHALGFRRTARLAARGLLIFKSQRYEALRLLCAWAIAEGDYSLAENLCRRMLALVPEGTGPMWDLAQLQLLRGEVAEAFQLFQRHSALTAGPDLVTRVLRRQHLDRDLAQRGKPYYRRLANVVVDSAHWTIMDEGAIYSDDTLGKNLYANPLVRGRITPDGKTVVAIYREPLRTIDEECIFVGGDDNFSHWLFRYLLKLSTLDRAGLLRSYPWLVNSDLRDFQRQYLDLLEIRPEHLVPIDRNEVYRCRNLVVPALLISSDAIRAGADWIRQALAPCMAASARRLIYVSRRDTPRRMLLNEDSLMRELSAIGFELVVPGELTVVEQIRTFSEARLIVATHGAALTNILFAPHDSSILEITSSAIAIMDDFRRIAASMGQRMETLVSDRFPEGAGPLHPNSDYLVDIDAVLRRVHALMR